jgi:hypothetical protein
MITDDAYKIISQSSLGGSSDLLLVIVAAMVNNSAEVRGISKCLLL